MPTPLRRGARRVIGEEPAVGPSGPLAGALAAALPAPDEAAVGVAVGVDLVAKGAQ